jgi:F0F1-type ATP synthase membrane subunit b/b'
MSQQMTEAMKSAKTIQQEMTQWENRLESTKNEVENLKRQAKLLEDEMDAKRVAYAGYISEKEKQIREGYNKNFSDQQTLNSQRDEFKNSLDQHIKEKNLLVQEKADFEKEKSRFLGAKQKVDGFVQAVRRAYSLIAE